MSNKFMSNNSGITSHHAAVVPLRGLVMLRDHHLCPSGQLQVVFGIYLLSALHVVL